MADQSPLTLAELRERREELITLAERYGAYNLRVFGSVARGDAEANSDIDFFVSFRAGASLYDLSGLKQDFASTLQRPVDILVDHPRMRERLRRNILQYAVPL